MFRNVQHYENNTQPLKVATNIQFVPSQNLLAACSNRSVNLYDMRWPDNHIEILKIANNEGSKNDLTQVLFHPEQSRVKFF